MKTRFAKTGNAVLFVAGALLIVVGAFIIMAPAGFYASNNIAVGSSVSLLNELKAPAGLLLAAGVFMLSAIFVRRQADGCLVVGGADLPVLCVLAPREHFFRWCSRCRPCAGRSA